MKTKSTILFASLFIVFIIQNTKAQNWEFVGLDSMVIYGLEVRGDTIWAGTRDVSPNAKSGLYKSIDQGQHWAKLDSTLGDGVVALFLVNEDDHAKIHLIKGVSNWGNSSNFYKTENDGENWDTINTPDNKPIKDFILSPIVTDEYYVVTNTLGHEWSTLQLFHKTTDAGNYWEYKCCPGEQEHGMGMNFAIDKINPNTLYISGASAGQFFTKSTNRGDTWEYLPGLEYGRVFTDYFLQDRIYHFRYQEQIYTNDGGFTWQEMEGEFSSSAFFFSFYQDEMTSVLYALSDEGLFYSDNVNIFWRLIPGSENLPVIQPINYSSTIRNISTDNNFIYTGSASGIYRTDFVTEVNEQNNNEQPTEFYLAQNYPNPFNPSTKIEFSLPSRANIQLNVFNMLGQKVVELANGNYDAGNYSFVYNAGNLPSGVYFYQLIADNFNQMKKMQLLK